MSSWLIVAMAMERVVAVFYPIKKAFLCTQMGAVTVIFTLVILLAYTQVRSRERERERERERHEYDRHMCMRHVYERCV